MAEWVSLVKEVGFPIAAFLLLFWSVIKAVKWYANNIALPKARADVALLDSVRETNDKHSESQSKLVEAQLMQSTLLQQLARGQEVQTALLRDLAGKHMECPMKGQQK